MVRADGQTPPEGAGVPDPLRRRRGPGVRGGRRRATGPGRAPEAVREVRPDPPSGEDPAGAVPGASTGGPPGPPPGATWHVRLLGVHPLLGSDAQGDLDGEAQDGDGPLPPILEVDSGLVP